MALTKCPNAADRTGRWALSDEDQMIHANPAPAGHAAQKWLRTAVVVMFALAPWVSLGFATPFAFTVAAVLFSRVSKIHAITLWSSVAIYTATVTTELAEANTASDPTGNPVFIACLAITTVVGGLQALAFTIVATAKGYRPIRGRATTNVPTKADPGRRHPRSLRGTAGGAHRTAEGIHRNDTRAQTRTQEDLATIAGAIFMMVVYPLLTFVLIQDITFQRHHQDATATIISGRVSTECNGYPFPTCTDVYYATVRFTTARGEAIEAETHLRGVNTSARTPARMINNGDSITVHYNPNDPRDVRLDTGWGSFDVVFTELMIGLCGWETFVVVRVNGFRRFLLDDSEDQVRT